MKQTRQNIWNMFDGKSKTGSFYDIIMMIVIVVSLVPLIFNRETTALLEKLSDLKNKGVLTEEEFDS